LNSGKIVKILLRSFFSR